MDIDENGDLATGVPDVSGYSLDELDELVKAGNPLLLAYMKRLEQELRAGRDDPLCCGSQNWLLDDHEGHQR